MTNIEELTERLSLLPDVYPGFVESTVRSLKKHNMVEEILNVLDENPNATTETVLLYEMQRRGIIEVVPDEEGGGQ